MIEWFLTSVYVSFVGILVKETTYGNDWTWFQFSFWMTMILWILLACHEFVQYETRSRKSNTKLRKFINKHFSIARIENIFQVLSLLFTLVYWSILLHQIYFSDIGKESLAKLEETVEKNVMLMNQSYAKIEQSMNFLGKG